MTRSSYRRHLRVLDGGKRARQRVSYPAVIMLLSVAVLATTLVLIAAGVFR